MPLFTDSISDGFIKYFKEKFGFAEHEVIDLYDLLEKGRTFQNSLLRFSSKNVVELCLQKLSGKIVQWDKPDQINVDEPFKIGVSLKF